MAFCKGCGTAGRCIGIGPYGSACRGGRPCPPGPDNATPCRAGPVCPAGGAGKIRVGPSRTPAPTKAYLVVRRGGALPLPRATARVAPTERFVGVDDPVRPAPITQRLVGQGPCALPWVRGKNPPATASPCQPPLGKGAWGRENGLPQPVCALASQ